jgi:branched-chain amino acid transport system substrate-binding protein
VFGVSTIVTAGITLSPMIERDKVPHLQAIGSVDVVKPLRYSFPIRTMPETETTLLAAFIKNYMKLGTKKIGVVYQADFTTPVTNFRRAAQAAGLNIVVEQSVPPIPNTCVNEMLNVANKGAEVVVLIAGPLPAICVLRDSKSVNFQPTWTGPAGWNFNITNTATGGATEGALTFGGWRTLETPEGQHYIEQRRKYFGADGDAESDDLAIVAYWEARLWIEALRRAGREVTRESFVDTMEAMSGYDTGFLPPGEWSPGDHTGARSVCIFKAVNGKWVTSDRQWHRSF